VGINWTSERIKTGNSISCAIRAGPNFLFDGYSITQHAQTLYEIRAILSEIDGLKSDIEKLDGQIGILFVDEDKVQARKLLKTRIQGLLSALEKIAKRNSEMK
jgi:chaperonin cofactor prefoldin